MTDDASLPAGLALAVCGNVVTVNDEPQGLLHPLLRSPWSPTTFDVSMGLHPPNPAGAIQDCCATPLLILKSRFSLG